MLRGTAKRKTEKKKKIGTRWQDTQLVWILNKQLKIIYLFQIQILPVFNFIRYPIVLFAKSGNPIKRESNPFFPLSLYCCLQCDGWNSSSHPGPWMRPHSRDGGTLSWEKSGFFRVSWVEWPYQPCTDHLWAYFTWTKYMSILFRLFLFGGFLFHVAEPNSNYYMDPPTVKN